MRVADLINLASEYLKFGIIVVIFIMACIFAGYFGVYRKLLKGQRKIGWRVFLWWGIFICYLSVVLGATLLNRGGFWLNGKIQPLFYSYKEAWINCSSAAWRNIILNFCMFIPFGIWLPLGIKWFRKFWKTYLVGFVFSLFIECIQLVFRRGIFELDDILGNTVGAMIGYGLFAIALLIVNKIKKRESKIISAAVLQLPLIMTTAAFTMIFVKYNMQELGNNPYQYIEAYSSDMISIKGESEFSTEAKDLNVYKTVILTVEEAKENGEKIFEALGTKIDESRTDIYDETIVLYSDTGNYSLWIDYQGGTYELTCFDAISPDDDTISEPVSGVDEEIIRSELKAMGFEIPEEAVFEELELGEYQFEIAMLKTEEGIINGILVCSYYGEKGIGRISNCLITGTPYKAYPAISEQEAYNKIVNGEFRWGSNGRLEIQVESCSLVYYIDSKGYYQPNYQFGCLINGEESEIIIPAINFSSAVLKMK